MTEAKDESRKSRKWYVIGGITAILIITGVVLYFVFKWVDYI